MTVELERDEKHETLVGWRYINLDDGRRTAEIFCPGCARSGTLDDFDIGSDGSVPERVECPYIDCTFSDFVRLIGWEPLP